MLPAIGSLSALNSGGRIGVVIDARPPAEPADGRQLAALQLRTVDQRESRARRPPGSAASPRSPPRRPSGRAQAGAPSPRGTSAPPRRPRRLPEQLSQLAGDVAGPIEDISHHGPDGRPHAGDGAVGIRAAATGGDGVELQRCGGRLAMVTAPIDPRPRDSAVARLGHRLYAEAQSNQAQGMQLRAASPSTIRARSAGPEVVAST